MFVLHGLTSSKRFVSIRLKIEIGMDCIALVLNIWHRWEEKSVRFGCACAMNGKFGILKQRRKKMKYSKIKSTQFLFGTYFVSVHIHFESDIKCSTSQNIPYK